MHSCFADSDTSTGCCKMLETSNSPILFPQGFCWGGLICILILSWGQQQEGTGFKWEWLRIFPPKQVLSHSHLKILGRKAWKSQYENSRKAGESLVPASAMHCGCAWPGQRNSWHSWDCNNSPVERLVSVLLLAQLGDQAGTAGRVVPQVGGLLLQLLSDTFS